MIVRNKTRNWLKLKQPYYYYYYYYHNGIHKNRMDVNALRIRVFEYLNIRKYFHDVSKYK